MSQTPIEDFDALADDGLLFACRLDGLGGASLIGWDDVEGHTDRADDPVWIHLDLGSARARTWLREQGGMSEVTASALLADETRPRTFRGVRGVTSILRGINSNEDAEAEDMVALRLWSNGRRVVTLRDRRLTTPRDVLSRLVVDGTGPKSVSQLYERLITRLTERMARTIDAYDERLDALDVELDLSRAAETRRALGDLRQGIVKVRRHVSPQRDALQELLADPPDWFEEISRAHLRETTDRLQRFVEELDAARERTMLIKDDIANRIAESTNRTLYLLSIVSAVFLPLGFLTGLLGINVGGMPGANDPAAFAVVTALMLLIALGELILFRRMKWLG